MNYPAASNGELISLGLINPCPPQVGLSAWRIEMVIKTEYNKIVSYTTKDGALIRELMHRDIQGNSKQSLAEAIIPPDSQTMLYKHTQTKEIYHITEGVGLMTLKC